MPYLAFSVMLAAGLEGIEKNYEVPEPIEENVYEMSEEERVKRLAKYKKKVNKIRIKNLNKKKRAREKVKNKKTRNIDDQIKEDNNMY